MNSDSSSLTGPRAHNSIAIPLWRSLELKRKREEQKTAQLPNSEFLDRVVSHMRSTALVRDLVGEGPDKTDASLRVLLMQSRLVKWRARAELDADMRSPVRFFKSGFQ
ncbi:hypothetical protein CT0861_10108, partial [Colletotrichum tofieldiae]